MLALRMLLLGAFGGALGFGLLAGAQVWMRFGGAEPAPAPPAVIFECSTGLEAACASFCDPKALPHDGERLLARTPAYQAELAAKLPRFQQAWDASGPQLLAATRSLIGADFSEPELRATLHVFPGLPSMATPLSINAVSFLDAATADLAGLQSPLPLDLFVGVAYHELLHRYVTALFRGKASKVAARLDPALLDPAENFALVAGHLHVFAIVRRVHEQLGLPKQLARFRAQDAVFGPEYRRAWALVDRDALCDALIAELRAAAEAR